MSDGLALVSRGAQILCHTLLAGEAGRPALGFSRCFVPLLCPSSCKKQFLTALQLLEAGEALALLGAQRR